MAKRNKALDDWLGASKKVNQELAEDPEARAAAEEQSQAAGEDPPHSDPTDEESVPAVEETEAPASEAPPPDEAAQAAEEAATAAAAEEATPPAPDESARELKNAQEKAKRIERERDEGRRQLAETRRQLAELQARQASVAPPTVVADSPKPPNDPEPNPDTNPVEHDQWLAREALREARATRADAEARYAALESRLTTAETNTQQQRMENDFIALMDQEKANFKVDHPDFDARLDHVKTSLRRQMAINGVPAHQIEASLRDQERRFLVGQTALAQQAGEAYPGQYALERLSELADTYGYRPEEPGEETPTAAPAKTNGRPAPSAAKTIEDRNKRATAARTATTMSGSAPQTYDPDAKMTAERFTQMTWAQREAYKKAHPGTLDRIMSEGEESGGVNPLLVGR